MDVLKLVCYEELTYAVLQQPVRVWYGAGFIKLGTLGAIKPWVPLSITTNLRYGKYLFADILIYYNN